MAQAVQAQPFVEAVCKKIFLLFALYFEPVMGDIEQRIVFGIEARMECHLR